MARFGRGLLDVRARRVPPRTRKKARRARVVVVEETTGDGEDSAESGGKGDAAAASTAAPSFYASTEKVRAENCGSIGELSHDSAVKRMQFHTQCRSACNQRDG